MQRTIKRIVWAVMILFAASVQAQEAPAHKEFTFKRLKVPAPGSGNRIKVQVDPVKQAAYLKPPEPIVPDLLPDADPAAPTLDPYDWYWSVIPAGSPDSIGATGGGRLENAVNHLNKSPVGQQVPTPRLQTLQAVTEKYGRNILAATIGTSVSPAMVLSVISVESSGRVDAVSEAGAKGLMQLIPATAERFGVSDISDPVQNIKGGVAYLDWLMNAFDNDPLLVLAAYNAGENAVRRHSGVPPYKETRAYVPKVLAAWTVARGLCLTPPQLMSDGCVFASREVKK